ncbi:MAG: serine hydrolase domain-containing protein [Pseudomonadota bacterium]
MLRLLALVLAVATTAAQAQDATRTAAIEAAWRGWLEGKRVGASSIAISYDGVIVAEAGRGMTARDPATLASLSKAITAACLRQAVEAGHLSYDDPISDYIATDIPANVGQLVTHSAGLSGDSTQRLMWDWVNDPTPRHTDVAEAALAKPPGPQTAYRYSNDNYAAVGHLIESAIGQPYTDYCTDTVTAPLKITSPPMSPRYGGFTAWGGWQMSAYDYLRLVEAHLRDHDPRATPHADVGGGARYGMGTLFFQAQGQTIYWHLGLLCFGSIDGAGAYFALVGDGYGVAVTFEGCAGEDALTELDQALLTAIIR